MVQNILLESILGKVIPTELYLLIPSYLIKVVGIVFSNNKIDSKQIGFWHSLQPLGHWLLHGQPKIEKNKALV